MNVNGLEKEHRERSETQTGGSVVLDVTKRMELSAVSTVRFARATLTSGTGLDPICVSGATSAACNTRGESVKRLISTVAKANLDCNKNVRIVAYQKCVAEAAILQDYFSIGLNRRGTR